MCWFYAQRQTRPTNRTNRKLTVGRRHLKQDVPLGTSHKALSFSKSSPASGIAVHDLCLAFLFPVTTEQHPQLACSDSTRVLTSFTISTAIWRSISTASAFSPIWRLASSCGRLAFRREITRAARRTRSRKVGCLLTRVNTIDALQSI